MMKKKSDGGIRFKAILGIVLSVLFAPLTNPIGLLVMGLLPLSCSILFLITRHPAAGIAYTILFVITRIGGEATLLGYAIILVLVVIFLCVDYNSYMEWRQKKYEKQKREQHGQAEIDSGKDQ